LQLLQTIRRDLFSKFMGEVLSRMVFLLFFFYVGRKLGTTDFGTLSLAISVTYILGVFFLDPGLNLSTIHMLVEHPERAQQISGSIFSWKLLLFFPLLLVLGVMSVTLGDRMPRFYVLFLASLYTLFTAVLEYLSSVTNAYHRMDLEAFLKILNRVLIVLLGIASLAIGRIPALLAAMAVATGIACLIAWVVLARWVIRLTPKWNLTAVRDAFRIGLPIAGTAIITTVYLKWDLLVLSYFNIGREQIGWYAGGFKIVEAFSALPTILGTALFPVIVHLRTRDPRSLDRLLGVTTKAVLLFAMPVAAAVSIFSRKIVLLVYGAAYSPGGDVLAILIWCIVPMFVYFYLVFVNIAAGHAKHNLLAGCAALTAGLTANVILVPRIGYLGAAWSALIANASFALLAIWKVCKLFPSAGLPAMFLRLITAGGILIVVIFFTPGPLAVKLLAGVVVYFVVLIALGSLGARDLSLAVHLFELGTQPQGQQP
jgi:O-antigen/teichoic acid export membrane protein